VSKGSVHPDAPVEQAQALRIVLGDHLFLDRTVRVLGVFVEGNDQGTLVHPIVRGDDE